MGRIIRAKAARPGLGRYHHGSNDGHRASGGAPVSRYGAVQDWTNDDRPISASLAEARARYAATVVERDRGDDSIRRIAVRVTRVSGLRLEDIRQLTMRDVMALVDDLEAMAHG